MSMIDNIRRIGIFMIVAQTVIHFASGKQYERYIKIIAGVLILLQFISPFASSSGDFVEKWQDEIEGMMGQMEEQNQAWQVVPSAAGPVEAMVLQQIEEEMKSRMNDIVSDYDCEVTDVEIDLEQMGESAGLRTDAGNRSWNFRRVKVTLQKSEVSDLPDTRSQDAPDDTIIRIEEITVGNGNRTDVVRQEGRDMDQDAKTQRYQHLFAQALGIAEDRVEVTYRGEW